MSGARPFAERSFATRFFVAAAVLLCAGFTLLALGQGRLDERAFQEARLVAVARAAAWVSAQEALSEEEAAEGQTQRFLQAAKEKVPGLTEALVLKNTKLLAHTDPARAGGRLDRDSLADKDLYDAGARLKAIVRKNIEERQRNEKLTGYAWPEHEVEPGKAKSSLVVRVAQKEEGDFEALVQVVGAEVEAPVPFPWLLLVFALVFAGVFFGLSRKLEGKAALSAGLALLCVLAALQAFSLLSWRDDLRRSLAEARAETYGQLVSAGLLAAAAEGEEKTLLPWLDEDVKGRPAKALGALEPPLQPTEQAPRKAGVAFDVEGARVVFEPAWFEEARARDLGHLAQWGFAFALVSLAIFGLGAIGRLSAAWRAFVEHRSAYAYLSPAMAGMLVLVFIPVVFGIVIGFLQRSYNVFEFAGLANYVAILSEFDVTKPTNFYFKLAVTLLWTVSNVTLHVVIGLILALLLNDQMLKARGVYRVLLIVPWALPNYITALIWKGMFHKQFGAINAFLEMLGAEPIAWFQTFWPAFFTNLATNTWLGFPFMMVVSLGALQSIPADLYEAARVDGATHWQRFWKITLPLLMPALVPAVIVGTVWTFNMFNVIYLVSGGAPNGATDILITDAFRWAFERDRYGYAAAYSTLIFLLLLGFTAVTNKITGATKGAFE